MSSVFTYVRVKISVCVSRRRSVCVCLCWSVRCRAVKMHGWFWMSRCLDFVCRCVCLWELTKRKRKRGLAFCKKRYLKNVDVVFRLCEKFPTWKIGIPLFSTYLLHICTWTQRKQMWHKGAPLSLKSQSDMPAPHFNWLWADNLLAFAHPLYLFTLFSTNNTYLITF